MIPLENSDEEFPWKQTVVLFGSVLSRPQSEHRPVRPAAQSSARNNEEQA